MSSYPALQPLRSSLRVLQVHPGPGVARGNDYTLFALSAGIVTFKKNKYIKQVRNTALACAQHAPACMHDAALALGFVVGSAFCSCMPAMDMYGGAACSRQALMEV